MKKHIVIIALALTSSANPGAVLAQTTTATATAELNIRSGPGPQYPSVGLIASDDATIVDGCLQGSKWCQVNYEGVSG
ncbi:MAG: hypothetical protein EON56_00970, partial [Alphaproteobacteria bacterium]